MKNTCAIITKFPELQSRISNFLLARTPDGGDAGGQRQHKLRAEPGWQNRGPTPVLRLRVANASLQGTQASVQPLNTDTGAPAVLVTQYHWCWAQGLAHGTNPLGSFVMSQGQELLGATCQRPQNQLEPTARDGSHQPQGLVHIQVNYKSTKCKLRALSRASSLGVVIAVVGPRRQQPSCKPHGAYMGSGLPHPNVGLCELPTNILAYFKLLQPSR